MSARYEITDHGSKLHVRDNKYGSEVSMLRVKSYSRELTVMAGAIRQQSADIAELRAELAAAVAERDRIKGDYDEAAHFARHFIRDDPNITPRGAIIRLGDKCTDLFVRLQQAEARLSAIDSAPVVAVVREMKRDFASGPYKFIYYDSDNLPAGCTELIAKPAKD